MNTITLSEAMQKLLQGGVGIMPTDTVYGIVAPARDKNAVQRLYELKDRHHKPGTLIAASVDQLLQLGVDTTFMQQAAPFWPGSLSAILPITGAFAYLHQGLGDIAMRVTDDGKLHELLLTTGPLLTSSANHPGKPGATSVEEAMDYFEERVDFYVDGGDLSDRLPSTIVKLHENGEIEVIRQGSVHIS